jgi:acyl carrier protein
VDVLPLLKSGKVDRAALRATPSRPELAGVFLRGTQARVAELWADTLPEWPVSSDVDFISAGGDSLRLVALRTQLEQEFDVSLSLAELLEANSVAGMAAAIELARRKAVTS